MENRFIRVTYSIIPCAYWCASTGTGYYVVSKRIFQVYSTTQPAPGAPEEKIALRVEFIFNRKHFYLCVSCTRGREFPDCFNSLVKYGSITYYCIHRSYFKLMIANRRRNASQCGLLRLGRQKERSKSESLPTSIFPICTITRFVRYEGNPAFEICTLH